MTVASTVVQPWGIYEPAANSRDFAHRGQIDQLDQLQKQLDPEFLALGDGLKPLTNRFFLKDRRSLSD
jgi:hypothetical protein